MRSLAFAFALPVACLAVHVVGNTNPALFEALPAVANGGILTFKPAPNAHGSATISVRVQDNGGTANGGVDQSTPQAFTITVTEVNDAPAGADNTVVALQNGSKTFAAADFGFTDPDDSPAKNFSRVKLTTLPTAGTLSVVGMGPLSAGDFVTVADIGAGKLVFTPTAGATGVPYTNFTFQVEDDGGTANAGVNLDQSPNKMVIIVWRLTNNSNCVPGDSPEVAASGNAVFLGTPRPDVVGTVLTQLSTCIHGASAVLPPLSEGKTKYQVTFSYSLFTWDSYNTAVGAGTGYYDSFSVSVSHVPYQDLGLTDPVTTANVPGLGFIWGGDNFADGKLECKPSTNATNFGCGSEFSFDAVAPAQTTVVMVASVAGVNWLNVVLDTKSLPNANHIHPSYGRIRILSIVPVP